jgi:hypothetical protein
VKQSHNQLSQVIMGTIGKRRALSNELLHLLVNAGLGS